MNNSLLVDTRYVFIIPKIAVLTFLKKVVSSHLNAGQKTFADFWAASGAGAASGSEMWNF